MFELENFPLMSKNTSWTDNEEVDSSIYDVKKEWPRISIVTPSYNQGEYIEETIRSILLQNYPNLEYIIIDGGSTDNTVEIIQKYEQWITYWVSEKDNGQSHALNKGIKKCTGEIFNWINSDDYLAKGALYEVGKQFAEKELDVLCGYCVLFWPNNPKKSFSQQMRVDKTPESTIVFHKINQQATFFRLEKIRQLDNINETLHYCMDLELWMRYLSTFGQQNIGKTDETLAFFRLHDSTKSSTSLSKFDAERALIFNTLIKRTKITPRNYRELNFLFQEYRKGYQEKKWEINSTFDAKSFQLLIEKKLFEFKVRRLVKSILPNSIIESIRTVEKYIFRLLKNK